MKTSFHLDPTRIQTLINHCSADVKMGKFYDGNFFLAVNDVVIYTDKTTDLQVKAGFMVLSRFVDLANKYMSSVNPTEPKDNTCP